MWDKIQFPKDAFAWIEQHHGLASWLEAVGVIGALTVTIWLAQSDRRERIRERKRKAQGLALLLHTEMVDFRGSIEAAIASDRLDSKWLAPPNSLVNHAAELYLLGSAGGNLLQMASTLQATVRQVTEIQRADKLIDQELRAGIAANLRLARQACDEAIRGLDVIIAG